MKVDTIKELKPEETGIVLQPCPFCGSAGVALSREYTLKTRFRENGTRYGYDYAGTTRSTRAHRIDGKVVERDIIFHMFKYKKYVVCCSNKSCIARKTTTSLRELRDAAAKWNRRASI